MSNRYIFVGDFVDRGVAGVEVLTALLAMRSGCPKGAAHISSRNTPFRGCVKLVPAVPLTAIPHTAVPHTAFPHTAVFCSAGTGLFLAGWCWL